MPVCQGCTNVEAKRGGGGGSRNKTKKKKGRGRKGKGLYCRGRRCFSREREYIKEEEKGGWERRAMGRNKGTSFSSDQAGQAVVCSLVVLPVPSDAGKIKMPSKAPASARTRQTDRPVTTSERGVPDSTRPGSPTRAFSPQALF